MRRRRRKTLWIAVVILLVLLAAVWRAGGFPALLSRIGLGKSPVEADGLCYTPYRNGWSVSMAEGFDGEELTIPASYEKKPVLRFDELHGASELKKLTIHLRKDTWNFDGSMFGSLGGIEELRLISEVGSKIRFRENAFDGCADLSSLTIEGGNVTFEANSFPDTPYFREMILSDGSFELKDRCMEKEYCLESLTLDKAVLTISASSGFYHAAVDELTVRDTELELSKYRIGELYPTVSVGTLRLGAGARISAMTETAYPVGKLVLLDDFSFANGRVSMTLRYGLLGAKTRTAPISEEIHIPAGLTAIPAGFFGNEDPCTVYYGGQAADFDTISVEREDNQALMDGLVQIYGLEQSSVTVFFHTENGEEAREERVLYGHTVSRPEDPIRGGYAFAGWFTDAANGRLWSFGEDAVTEDTHLYAQWISLDTYSDCEIVEWNGFKRTEEGGEIRYSQTVEADRNTLDLSQSLAWSDYATVTVREENGAGALPLTAVPLRDGENRFVLTVVSGNGQNQNEYLLVILRPYLCTVTFDDGAAVTSVSAFTGSLLEAMQAEREGYTLKGWLWQDLPWDFSAMPVTESMRLTAQWEAKTYRITLSGHGESVVTYGESYTLPAPYAVGSTFNGWKTEDGNFLTDVEGHSLMPWSLDADTVLVPDFAVHTYRITYENLLGGSNSNPKTFGADQTLVLQSPSARGYSFVGWVDEEGYAVRQIPAGQTEDVCLIAVWSPDVYTLVYENTRGNRIPSDSYTIEDCKQLPVLSETGYTFLGWSLNGDVISEIPQGSVGDLTLSAVWQADTYSIAYGGLENGTHQNPAVYEYGTGLHLADASREGYDFLGWYSEDRLVAEIPADSTGEISLTARWSLRFYTVTFTDSLGNLLHTEKVAHGDSVKTPPSPPAIHHKIFIGWSESVHGITSDRTLTPLYGEHTYTVTFDTDGGTAVDAQNVYYGEIPSRPITPTRGDIVFENWCLPDGTAYDFSYPLNGDTVILAVWRDYTPIYTAEDFAAMEGSGGKFRLMNDINFYNDVFTPIRSFSGSFDGCGYTLSSFSLNGTADLSMFLTNTGTIRNLTVRKASAQMAVETDAVILSLLVGQNEGTIENCHLEDCFLGMEKTASFTCGPAGLLTAVNSGTIKGSTVRSAEVHLSWAYNTHRTGYDGVPPRFGGIAGQSSGTIEDCVADVSVDFVSPYKTNSYWHWDDTDDTYMMIGSVTGCMTGGRMRNCVGDLTLCGTAEGGVGTTLIRIGGLLGYGDTGRMENCVSSVDVRIEQNTDRAAVYLGGAVGAVKTGFEVQNCAVYGLIGRNDTAFSNHVGGFTAQNNGNIRNCYSMVDLDVGRDAGAAGFCAENTSSGTIRACFSVGNLYAVSGCLPEAFVDANSGGILSCYYDSSVTVIDGMNATKSASDAYASSADRERIASALFVTDELFWNPAIWNGRDGYWPTLVQTAVPSAVIVSANHHRYGNITVSDPYPTPEGTVTLTATPSDTVLFEGWYRKGSDECLSENLTYSFTAKVGILLIEARFRAKDLHVYTYEDLTRISRYQTADTTVWIMNDINCMGAALPMVENFHGTLEGGGFAVYNFANTLSEAGESALIRNNHGTVRDLTLSGSAVASATNGTTKISFLAVYNHEDGIIENCRAVGSLKITGGGGRDSYTFGGFAAENAGTIRACRLYVRDPAEGIGERMVFHTHVVSRIEFGSGNRSVQATLYGGFVAGRNTGKILSCDNEGASFGTHDAYAQFENNVIIYREGFLAADAMGQGYMNVFVGGITGSNDTGGTVSACVDSAAMYVNDLAGTDIWGERGGSFLGVHGALFHSDVNIGGIAGRNDGSIDHSRSEGMVTYSSDNINRMSASTAGLMDDLHSAVGGISGKNTGTVENSAHRGILIVTSAQKTYVGGLSGENSGTVSNCYGGGMILAEGISDDKPVYLNLKFWSGFGGSRYRHGAVSVGGLVGRNESGATIANSLANFRFDEMNNCEEMSTYERVINILLLPVHVRDAFKAIFVRTPAYADVLQIGTIAGNEQNAGNIQNCYYVQNGEYTYTGGSKLTDRLFDLTADMIQGKLHWTVTDDSAELHDHEWLVVVDYIPDPDDTVGDAVLIPTISLIPKGTEKPGKP